MSEMSYTTLGQSGLVVSRLALGTMTFTLGSEFIPGVAAVGQDEATEMVAAALDAGVNFFDSANGYSSGDAEKILGTALKGRRQEAVICTKLGFRQGPGIGNAGLPFDLLRPDIRKTIGPPVHVTVVTANIDDLHRIRRACKRLC